MSESWPNLAVAVLNPTPFGPWPAVVFIVLILAALGFAMVKAERGLRGMRGSKLRRGKSERHAMSRLIAGLGRWGSGGGGSTG